MSAEFIPELAPEVTTRLGELAETFATAQPFRFLHLEKFVDEELARELLNQFPTFSAGSRRNEAGQLGGKSCVRNVRDLGDAYVRFDELMRSSEFLAHLGRITGIPDLLYDPEYLGGGTHDNLSGQSLDLHIDFNRHPTTGWHRRLNLILCLNEEWDESWGGCLELAADPYSRNRENGTRRQYPPRFNHALLFETNERSWHGFSEIRIPTQASITSRKTIAVYFYTADRPSSEVASSHTTVYISPPLPPRYRAGYTLALEDEQELVRLVQRRDHHLKFVYQRETDLRTELERLRNVADPWRQAFAQQLLNPERSARIMRLEGLHRDMWAGRSVLIEGTAQAPLSRLLVKGQSETYMQGRREFSATLDGKQIFWAATDQPRFELAIPLRVAAEQAFSIRLDCSYGIVGADAGINPDRRELSWLLREAFLH